MVIRLVSFFEYSLTPRITIHQGEKTFHFPYYGWLVKGTYKVRAGTAYVPKMDPLLDIRADGLADAQKNYKWMKHEGVYFTARNT